MTLKLPKTSDTISQHYPTAHDCSWIPLKTVLLEARLRPYKFSRSPFCLRSQDSIAQWRNKLGVSQREDVLVASPQSLWMPTAHTYPQSCSIDLCVAFLLSHPVKVDERT
ncbi:unnamed protein product [Diplocarpon coronariae]